MERSQPPGISAMGTLVGEPRCGFYAFGIDSPTCWWILVIHGMSPICSAVKLIGWL